MDKLLFIHIPKTAGSSFRESMIKPNVSSYYNFRGLKNLYLKKNVVNNEVIGGHMPYGVHKIIKGSPKYFTFLRSPIDRAISHYFFMVQAANPKYPNANRPHRLLHQKTPLKDIFNATKSHKYRFSVFSLLDNLQTRYIAGYRYYWYSKDSNDLLKIAMKNLKENIELFGIQEQYQDSLQLFQNVFGWENYPVSQKLRNTRIEKVVNEEDMIVLENNHQLDLRLYEYGLELFEKQKSRFL